MRFITAEDLYHLLVIVLIKIGKRLPSSAWRSRIASWIGSFAFRFSRRKKQRMQKNIAIAFDGRLSKKEQERIILGAFQEFWKDTFLWLPSAEDLNGFKQASINGREHLDVALRAARGVILWESNGFGMRMASKLILHQNGIEVCQVHGMEHLGGFLITSPESYIRKSVIRRFFDDCEKRHVAEIVQLPDSNSLSFTRILSNRLKHNAILCVAGDGKTGQKLIGLDFLKGTEFFSTGMVSLAKISGAMILPMFCFRDETGKTVLIFENPISLDPDAARENILIDSLARYASILEEYVRRYPDQYKNWHLL